MIYGPVLSACDAKATACVALHEIISACLIEPMGASIRQVSYAVGSAVIAEMHLSVMKNRKVTPKELVKILEESGKNKSRHVNKFAKNYGRPPVGSQNVQSLGIVFDLEIGRRVHA